MQWSAERCRPYPIGEKSAGDNANIPSFDFGSPRAPDLVVQQRYVYGLRSLAHPGRYYTGITADVRRRMEWHNAGRCSDTSKHKPWELVAAIEFADERRAVAFEKYLKSGSGRAFARRHFG
jgi:predicted GIY-YIG superfamily endonuclease